MCKITPYIQGVVQCASINTLAAIAFDRFVHSHTPLVIVILMLVFILLHTVNHIAWLHSWNTCLCNRTFLDALHR